MTVVGHARGTTGEAGTPREDGAGARTAEVGDGGTRPVGRGRAGRVEVLRCAAVGLVAGVAWGAAARRGWRSSSTSRCSPGPGRC